MKKNKFNIVLYLLVIMLMITGCAKNETNYYADAENPGIAIFSNTGNNLLTCFIDGKQWRTQSRTTLVLSPSTNYEVYMYRQSTGTLHDTLLITWQGYFSVNQSLAGTLSLHLAMPHNFSYQHLSALQGQRLHIDSTNGFFSTSINGLNTTLKKGSGNVYFQTAQLDSLSVNTSKGILSGLFDADFGSSKITKGRFDHVMTGRQVSL